MHRRLPILLVLVWMALGSYLGRAIVIQQIEGAMTVQAADFLPVFLATAALAEGRDPTDREVLKAVYQEKGLRTRAATFSTLYPVTMSGLLRPFARWPWDRSVIAWRWMLLVSCVGTGFLAASARPLRAAFRMWIPMAGVVMLLAFPVTPECVKLGQVNMFLGFLLAGIMLGLGRSSPTVAAVLASLGASIKIVPAAFFLPLVAGRRWAAVLTGGAVFLVIFAFASSLLDPRRIVQGIMEAIRFQDFVAPDWVGRHAGSAPWVVWLGVARHRPLMLLTICLGGTAVFLRPAPGVMLACAAMLSAWLGASASAFHVLYSPLFFPAWVWLAVWPFEKDASLRVAIPMALAAALAPWLLYHFDVPGMVIEARLVLAGEILWSLTCVRLVAAWRSASPSNLELRFPMIRGLLAPAAGLLVSGIFLYFTPERVLMGPPLPNGHPEGPGFIQEDEQAPGGVAPRSDAALAVEKAARIPLPSEPKLLWGVWPQVPAEATLHPGTRSALETHLATAVQEWGALARTQPAWSVEIQWVLDVAPVPTVPTNSVAELISFLGREGIILGYLRYAGIESGPVERSYEAALGRSARP